MPMYINGEREGGNMRILLAEDEKDLNKLITARLKEEFYSVDSCFDLERKHQEYSEQCKI